MTRNRRRPRESIKERVRRRVHEAFNQPPTPPPDALYFGKSPTGDYVWIRPRDLDTHLHVIGGSRRGKTNALRLLCKQLLRRKKKYGEGFAVIDPHGGLAEYVLELCAKEPDLADQVGYLTLKNPEHILSLNPLAQTGQDPYFVASCVKEALIKAFDKVRSPDKPLVSRVVVNMSQALYETRFTLLESDHFLNQGEEDEALKAAIVDQLPARSRARAYWQGFDRKTDQAVEFHTMGPANRLEPLIRPLVLRRILGQHTASLNFLDLMERGGIAIFDTSIGRNTEITTDGQELLNAVIVQQFRQAFPRRIEKGAREYKPELVRPFTLILDEFGSYTTPEFARTLTEASKFSLRCVFSHQNLAQLKGEDGDTQLLNAVLAIPNRIVFGNLPFEEAQELARHMYLSDLDPDEIKYQGETVTWDPIVEWGITSRTHTETTEPTRRTVAEDKTRSTTRSSDARIRAEQEAERKGVALSEADGPVVSDSEAEGYHTSYKKRIQKQPPIYRSVEEQVFKAARVMSTNPRGVSVVAFEDRKPSLCLFPNMDERPATDDELQVLFRRLLALPYHSTGKRADNLIEGRQTKLLESAKPQPVLKPAKKKPTQVRKSRKT